MQQKNERRPVAGSGAQEACQLTESTAAARGAQAVPLLLTSHVEVSASATPRALLDALTAAVTIPNPRYAAAVQAGRYTVEPRELTGALRDGDTVLLPRGALPRYRQIMAQHGAPVMYDDQRSRGADISLTHRRELRDYQARAVAEAVRRQQCVIVAPAGAGKSSIGIGLIAQLQTSALVIVGTLDLAEQWRREIREQLGTEAGYIGGGTYDVQPVTVAIVASLAMLDDVELAALHKRFGALLIDETHHAASPTWARVIGTSPAKYRIGLTATPTREDGLSELLGWHIGPEIQAVEHPELLQSGRLIAPRIDRLETQFRYEYLSPEDWAPLLDRIERDDARNRLIVDRVVADAAAGHSILVLTGRVEHAIALADALAVRGVGAAALHGKVAKRRRAELLEQARDGALSVVVATQIADEGLDLPRLSRLVLAFPARAAGRIEQRIGRVMRAHPDKLDAAVIDVVDVHVGVLAWQARQRANVFAAVLGARP